MQKQITDHKQNSEQLFYSNLLDAINQYPFDDASEIIQILKGEIEAGHNLRDHKNYRVHFGTKTFIFDPTYSQVLLLHHKGLDMWLQAGGHVDPEDETMVIGAKREGVEETGITELVYQPLDPNSPQTPIDISIHPIPHNPKKQEEAHSHCDFSYVFTTQSDRVKFDPTESNGSKWISFAEFEQIGRAHV